MKRRPHLLLPWVQSAVNSLNTAGYDQVIAVSSAWVKNIPLQPDQKCLVYCFSPARMLWDSWPTAMMSRTNNRLIQLYITRLTSRLRLWDYYTSQEKQRQFVAISQMIQKRIAKFYHRSSKLIYPPVIQPPVIVSQKQPYWVIVSVLAPYKQIDQAIRICIKRNERLVIVGSGPDLQRLEEVAQGNSKIQFVGRVSQKDKWRWLSDAQGFLFCSIEDFGIAPIESLGCGTPVVALNRGGLAETIRHLKTGVLYDEPTDDDLARAMELCLQTSWSEIELRKSAKRFRPEVFQTKFKDIAGPDRQ